jgi:hypothetical protein
MHAVILKASTLLITSYTFQGEESFSNVFEIGKWKSKQIAITHETKSTNFFNSRSKGITMRKGKGGK